MCRICCGTGEPGWQGRQDAAHRVGRGRAAHVPAGEEAQQRRGLARAEGNRAVVRPPGCCMLRASTVSDRFWASQWQGSVRQSSYLMRAHVVSKAGCTLPIEIIGNHVPVSWHVYGMCRSTSIKGRGSCAKAHAVGQLTAADPSRSSVRLVWIGHAAGWRRAGCRCWWSAPSTAPSSPSTPRSTPTRQARPASATQGCTHL